MTDTTGWADEFDLRFPTEGTISYPNFRGTKLEEEIKTFITELLSTQKREIIADLDTMMSKAHDGVGNKDFKTGMFRGFEAVKMLLDESSSL